MPDILDPEFMLNVAKSAPVGAAGGVLYELLRRKMQNQAPALTVPEEMASMPMLDRPQAVKKEKRSELQLGHAVGVLGGAAAGMKVVGKLMNRKKSNELDQALAQRDAEFNDLLMQEQGVASGVPHRTLSTLKTATVNRKIDQLLTKIAGTLYDQMQKKGDIVLRTLVDEAKKALGVTDRPAAQVLAGAAAVGGGLWGYNAMASKDPNRMASSTIRKALEERLTGKDKNMGPMPIRVESETPEMRPLKPGASSLVDPTKGRDVLDGI